MTTRADRGARTSTYGRDLGGDLTVRLEVGTRVATARVHADAGRPVQISVDDAALLWRELSRPALRATTRRIVALTPFEVRNTKGRRLMWSDRRRGRARVRLTPAGWLTLLRHWF